MTITRAKPKSFHRCIHNRDLFQILTALVRSVYVFRPENTISICEMCVLGIRAC